MNLLATLTNGQTCALVFLLGVSVIILCAKLLPFDDIWPE
jgi:hypothetical protein